MKKPAYYAAQELAYRQIRERGEAGWQVKSFDDFISPESKKLITNFVSSYFGSTSGLSALDVGTGTGTTAHILHDLGFSVTGIDVSESAIEHAKEIAGKFQKPIRFLGSDVLDLTEKFDLIYDSHCLHCIVFDEDRRKFFHKVAESLKIDGAFLLDTMTFSNDETWKEIPTLKFDENYILWHKTKPDSHTGVVQVGDTWWCPQRRIYPAEKILDELQSAGLEVIQKIEETGMLRCLCKKKGSR